MRLYRWFSIIIMDIAKYHNKMAYPDSEQQSLTKCNDDTRDFVETVGVPKKATVLSKLNIDWKCDTPNDTFK